MAFGVKTNERPGTRAQVRYVRMSAYKVREVLDLIRDKEVGLADEILKFGERDAAIVIRKCLASAVANARHNNGLEPDELYVAACFADEGPTLKRWRPRARGRATRIRKRTCHITVIVSRLPEDALERRRARDSAAPSGRAARRAGQQAAEARRARVARSRQRQVDEHDHEHEAATEEPVEELDAPVEDLEAPIEPEELEEGGELEDTTEDAEPVEDTDETDETDDAGDTDGEEE